MIVAYEKKNRTKRAEKAPIGERPPALPATLASPRHHFAAVPTAWGVCGIVWKLPPETTDISPKGFVEQPSEALLSRIILPGLPLADLRRRFLAEYPLSSEVIGDRCGNFHPEVVPAWFPEMVRSLRAYYSDNVHERVGFDFSDAWQFWQVRLDWSQLTPFQQAVLRETAMIPRGQKLTYGQIARRIGKPKAGRAVGAALGANPWPVLIPCHRVVGANGDLTGFSAPGGVGAKQRMLAMEAAPCSTDAPPTYPNRNL